MNYKILTTVLTAVFAALIPGMAFADPVSAVVAGTSLVSGLSAWGAATGFAAVAAGLQIAGGALSLVGAVTGNEKLAKIGGIAQLAGGIGTIANKLMTPAQAAKGVAQGGLDMAAEGLDAAGDATTAAGKAASAASDGAVATADPTHASWLSTPDIQPLNIAKNVKQPGLLERANTFFKDNGDTIKVVGSGINNMFDPKSDLYDAQAERERSLIGQAERDRAAVSASLNGVNIPVTTWASGQPVPNMPVGSTDPSVQNPLRFIPRPLIRRI